VVALGWRWWRLCGQQPVVLPPFSPSLFSHPRLGNGIGGVAAVLLVCAEAHASSSSSRVLQQGKEGGERLRKNDNGVSSAGGGGDGEWQRFAVGRKTMATNECSSPVLKQTPPCFQIFFVFSLFKTFPPLFCLLPSLYL